ncbi:MAG TPA: hypothetical protein VEW48_19020 [Thermoanaerobaculia bacterium]|nr:hypothetical protein [Thermoanaerobaculia bacterium]
MKKQQRTASGVLWVAAFGAVALLALGAGSSAAAPAGPAAKAPVGAAGMQVFLDPATGKMRPATAQEMKAMSDRLKGFLSRSSEGLKAQEHPNGMISLDLQGGFMNVWVASVSPDGKVTNACVNNYEAAEAILSGQAAPAYEEQ